MDALAFGPSTCTPTQASRRWSLWCNSDQGNRGMTCVCRSSRSFPKLPYMIKNILNQEAVKGYLEFIWAPGILGQVVWK